VQTRKEPDGTLPQEVLRGLSWSFIGTRFTDRAAFEEKVRVYQIAICGEDIWQPG